MIICARHAAHIALSNGDECEDDAIFVPCEDVPALIEALEKVTKEAPTCQRSGCDARATVTNQWTDNQGEIYTYVYCDEHGVTVTPIESVTEVTI